VTGSWDLLRASGSAAAFHDVEPRFDRGRRLVVFETETAGLVLGSTQPSRVVDPVAAEAAEVEVVRRRSGGGAVLVRPGELLWIEVWLPVDDPLWCPDVGHSFLWLGRAWARALASAGVAATVEIGPFEPGRWGRLVCFGSRGPGEVMVEGRKVVGIAQRRNRAGARFQCAALLTWDPGALVALLAMAEPERREAVADLSRLAAPAPVPGAVLADALRASLP
jgi:lipoate-protein ligase A